MIRNRRSIESAPRDTVALDCIESGIRAAHPERVVESRLTRDGTELVVDDTRYDLSSYDHVYVLGGGNAAGHLACAIDERFGDLIDEGVVVTDATVATTTIDVRPGDHPVPTPRGVENAARVLELAADATEDDLVIALVGGGGSALLTAPPDDLRLADLATTTSELLASGATIDEINAVRKHCSLVKGGRLARILAPATTVGLVLSDVDSDDLSVVASGPLSPDPSTYRDAVDVLDRYTLDVPHAVRRRLEQGLNGDRSETPTQDDPAFDTVSRHVLATGRTAIAAAVDTAREHGYEPLVLSASVRGEAVEAATSHVAVVEEIRATGRLVEPPAVLVSGGETTVTLGENHGEGGPNQEFALSAALELRTPAVTVASVDTDGIDGATSAAGALVDDQTVGNEVDRETARAALDRHDVFSLLGEIGARIETGPTGTNVNDLRIVVVERTT